MKGKIVVAAVFVCLFASSGLCDPDTEIWYETTDLGSGRWEYSYDVYNISLSVPIEEFTIWFDYGVYDSLVVTTPETPAGWEQIVWDPEPVLEDDGAYDAKALDMGIGIGGDVEGFSVSFDWLGVGEPGSQFYEIINPVTFETIESGWTVPEPGTICLLSFGVVLLLGRRRVG